MGVTAEYTVWFRDPKGKYVREIVLDEEGMNEDEIITEAKVLLQEDGYDVNVLEFYSIEKVSY